MRLHRLIALTSAGFAVAAGGASARRPAPERAPSESVAGSVAVSPGRRQLFLDDYLVGELRGLKRTLHSPRRYAGNPVLTPDRAWEDSADMPSALFEAERAKVRLWYRSTQRGTDPSAASADPQKSAAETVCRIGYAESRDGVHFQKPALGIVDFRGSKDNNLVWGRMGDWGNSVQMLPEEKDPARRYRTVIWAHPEHGGYSGNIGLWSADGLHWTMAPRPESGKLDHALNAWFDPLRNEYLSLIQFQTAPRTIGRMASPDFVNWGDRREVLRPDASDPVGTEFYSAFVTMLDDLYVCFLHVFHADPNERGTGARQHGTVDVQLATSRDGQHWERAAQRQVFLPLGMAGAFDDSMVFLSGPPVEMKDRLLFYFAGYDDEHGSRSRRAAIGLGTLRKDGFLSLEPEAASGELTTKPFRLDGRQVEISAEAMGGRVRIAACDVAGKPLPGYSYGDTRAITRNGFDMTPAWKHHKDLAGLRGRTIRLKLQLERARLYALEIRP